MGCHPMHCSQLIVWLRVTLGTMQRVARPVEEGRSHFSSLAGGTSRWRWAALGFLRDRCSYFKVERSLARLSEASTPYNSISSRLPHRAKCCRLEPSWRMPAFLSTAPEAGLRLKWCLRFLLHRRGVEPRERHPKRMVSGGASRS